MRCTHVSLWSFKWLRPDGRGILGGRTGQDWGFASIRLDQFSSAWGSGGNGGEGQLAFLLTRHLHALFAALFTAVIKGDVPKLSKNKFELLFK